MSGFVYLWVTWNDDPGGEGDAALFQRQPELQEEELVEDQGPVGGGRSPVELGQVAPAAGEMGLVEGARERDQRMPGRHVVREEALHAGGEAVHHLLHHLPHRLLVHPLGQGVDRDDPPEVERVAGHHLRQILPLRQPFHLGVVDLPLEAVLGHLAGEDAAPPLPPGLLDEGGIVVEPLEENGAAPVLHQHLEEALPPPGGGDVGALHLAGEDRGLAGAELRDRAELAAVLVAVREQVEGVLHRHHPAPGDRFGELRPDPLDELDMRLQVLAVDCFLEGGMGRLRHRRQHEVSRGVQLDAQAAARLEAEAVEQVGGEGDVVRIVEGDDRHGWVLLMACSGQPIPCQDISLSGEVYRTSVFLRESDRHS